MLFASIEMSEFSNLSDPRSVYKITQFLGKNSDKNSM